MLESSIEPVCFFMENRDMESSFDNSTPDSVADSQIVAECLAARKPVPPEVARRVRQRAEQARQNLLKSHGIQDVGVKIIREIRGELPQP
jgi:hypothetical protein